jgi:trans-aconitate methyltransferase
MESNARVNRLTRAYPPTLDWLSHVYSVMPWQTKPIHIVDVGCGYGDHLRQIHQWARDHHLPVILTGIDLNPDVIRVAREATRPGTITFLDGSAIQFKPPGGMDIVVTSQLTNVLEHGDIVELLQWMEDSTRLGWFVNDLHRQPLPYHLFRILSRFTTLHPFVKQEVPVSIRRSFRREDWVSLCSEAAIPDSCFQIREYGPARLCVARLK